jgi:hypothetical protein
MKVTERPDPTTAHKRIAVYGLPKSGKTRAVTALPWGEHWGERALYVAADPGSEELGSVLRNNREHLILVKPEPKSVGGKLIYDPLTESVAIATKNWKEEYPGVGTIIWDTMTTTSQELLAAYADSGQFSDKHVTFGQPGTAAYHAAPMEGDFGAAQRSTMFILKYLFRQPLNLIVVFHEDWVQPNEKDVLGAVYGGPTIVGKAGIKTIAAMFDNLFRFSAKDKVEQGNKTVTEYAVHTRHSGPWMAGFRNPHENNPIPKVPLKPDPINFWKAFDEAVEVMSATPEKVG